MKAVILAGGLGTRLTEETIVRPKPMIEIGGKPILWHIMKIYSAHGIERLRDLPRLPGLHDQGVLRELLPAHVATSRSTSRRTTWRSTSRAAEPWRVTLVDTGEETHDRRPPAARALATSATRTSASPTATASPTSTCRALIEFHREQATLATVTAVQPPGPLRRAASSTGERVTQLPREARRRRRLDQRRLLRALATRGRLHRRRRHRLGATSRSSGSPPTGELALVPARRLLAADGHAARQGAPRRAVGERRRAVEDVGLTRRPSGARRVLVTGHTGFKGSWLSLVWLAPERRLSATRTACRPIRRCSRTRAWTRCSRRSRGTSATGGTSPAIERAPARGRLPPGRPAARAPLVRGPGRDLRDERDGHGERARGRARRRRRGGRRRDERQGLRDHEPGRRHTRGRAARRHRPVQQQQGRRRARHCRLPAAFFGSGAGPAVATARAGQRHRRRRLGGGPARPGHRARARQRGGRS